MLGLEILKQLILVIAPEAMKSGWKFIKKVTKRKPKTQNKNEYYR